MYRARKVGRDGRSLSKLLDNEERITGRMGHRKAKSRREDGEDDSGASGC